MTSFSKQKDITEMGIKDLDNTWNFYKLFNSPHEDQVWWLRKHELLVDGRQNCPICQQPMKLQKSSGSKDKQILKCRQRHKLTIRHNSFFENSHLNFADIMLFVRQYAKDGILHSIAQGKKYFPR